MTAKLWWTIRELAEHYRVSQRSIRNEITRGRLVAHKLPSLRVADADRLAWELRNKSTHGETAEPPKPSKIPINLHAAGKRHGIL